MVRPISLPQTPIPELSLFRVHPNKDDFVVKSSLRPFSSGFRGPSGEGSFREEAFHLRPGTE